MQRRDRRGAAGGGEKDNFRPDIEGLRGIAVLLVLIFHAALLSNWDFKVLSWDIKPSGGFIGVDLFFVVSGFLITGLLIRERERTGRVSFSKFYARRVRRILPAAAVVLLVTIPLSSTLLTLIQRPDAMQDGAAAALSFANVRFALTTDYFNPVSYSPFLHFWSLGVEEQFYFVWPALLFVAAWKSPRLGAGLALGSIVVVSFLASLYMTDANPSWAFYMLPTRAWQLAAGGMLAIGAGSFARLPRSLRGVLSNLLVVLGWIALAALLYDAFTIDSRTIPYPGMAALLPTVAAVLLIASGTEARGPGMVLGWMPLRFIGKISYSLYLWHWPMLILGGTYLQGTLQSAGAPGQVQQFMTPQQALALALFSIPVAAVSWGLVEEPFRRGFIPLPRPSRTVLAGVTAMVVVAMIGVSFQWSAQAALADLGGPDTAIANANATDSAPPDDTLPPTTPTPRATVVTPKPGQSPTPGQSASPGQSAAPAPQMTPALTPSPDGPPPTSFAVTNALTPSLANASKDYEKPWKDNCLGFESSTVPAAWGKCVYGNTNGTYQVALIGDSHASALFPGINEVAKAHGWKLVVYMKVDCPFVDIPVIDFNLKREYPECGTWNDNVIARLNAHPPDLAIVSNMRQINYSNDADAGVTAQGNAMAREMEKIPSSSRVVMIQDIPDPWTYEVPVCLSNNLADYRNCAYSRASGFASYLGKREAVAVKATGAGLINLSSAICPGTGACPAVIDNMIVFRDQHHLTATFAKSLGPVIDQQLVALLAPPSSSPAPPTPSPASGG
jgi:peptidoglycan/LPS O-acetylase OafA/YrhL